MADQRRVTQLGIESDVDAGTATKRRVTQLGLESDVDAGLVTKRKITQLGLESDVDAGLVTERKVTQLLLEVDVEAVYHTYVSGVAMPDYAGDERGVPVAGDRAAWDVVEYPEHHARDLKDDAPVHHVPAGETTGDVPVWDGGKWASSAPDELPIADHDHSGDAGDGGTFDAANLTSGAATDGQILTADGAGNTTWEDAPGSPLTVEEQDGAPSVASVGKIRVTNGTLTDEGDGVVKLDFGAAATDGSAIHDNEAGEIHAVTEKETPADDDELLIEDSADSWAKKRVKMSNLPGGGTYDNAYASPPSSPSEGELWLPSDAPYILRRGASAWNRYGPIMPLFPPCPAIASLTWVNQDGATATETNGELYMSHTKDSANEVYLLVKALDHSSNYQITIAVQPDFVGAYHRAGIVLRNDTDGKIHGTLLMCRGSYIQACAHKWNNATSWSAAYVERTIPIAPLFLRVKDDGTNRISYYSLDGVHFTQYHTVGRTDFVTPTQCGFLIEAENGTYPVAARFLSWKEESL